MPDRIILIAEDDKETILSWEQDIREFNRLPGAEIRYIPEFARSKNAAIRILDRVRINCAVVDLRLPENDENPGGNDTNPIGNDILEKLLIEAGVPAVVYSGYTPEVSALVKASQIKVIGKKGGGAMEALQWLAGHASLMSAMEVTRKQIARACANLFSNSVWPRWEKNWKEIQDRDLLATIITRQVVSHVAEQLSMPASFHHPEEFYIIPPLATDRLLTGDMVTNDGSMYVLVTPRCNMARDYYPKNLTLALCKPMVERWAELKNGFNGTEKQRLSAEQRLHDFACQGHATATHFLPPCGDRGPWLVDFKEIDSVPSTQVAGLLAHRFASLAAPFVPNLVQRYAAYLGRIGQPDLDCDVLRAHICK